MVQAVLAFPAHVTWATARSVATHAGCTCSSAADRPATAWSWIGRFASAMPLRVHVSTDSPARAAYLPGTWQNNGMSSRDMDRHRDCVGDSNITCIAGHSGGPAVRAGISPDQVSAS